MTPAEAVSDTTTLCSLAFSLILKNNLKGYSAADLDLKLRVGYRYGSTLSEGCRVDNQILINVLAEISQAFCNDLGSMGALQFVTFR